MLYGLAIQRTLGTIVGDQVCVSDRLCVESVDQVHVSAGLSQPRVLKPDELLNTSFSGYQC